MHYASGEEWSNMAPDLVLVSAPTYVARPEVSGFTA
jgi:hypothetical protein